MSEKRPKLVGGKDAGVSAVCHAILALRCDAGGYVARNRNNQMARFLVSVQHNGCVYRRRSGLPDWKIIPGELAIRIGRWQFTIIFSPPLTKGGISI